MIMRAHTKEPVSVPNPAFGQEPAAGFRSPSAVLVKITNTMEDDCACCGRTVAEESCAVGIYSKPYCSRNARSFLYSSQILCPWCAELPEEELRHGLIRGVRSCMKVMKESLGDAANGDPSEAGREMFHVEVNAEQARALATACCGLILKAGESWTPTSHPHMKRKAVAV